MAFNRDSAVCDYGTVCPYMLYWKPHEILYAPLRLYEANYSVTAIIGLTTALHYIHLVYRPET